MRICIVADSASVRFGGEAILPYHYFRLLRQRGVEAWLVVHDRTRRELETLLPGDIDRMRFVPDLTLHKQLSRFSRFLPRRIAEATVGMLSHLLTQSYQRKLIRQLVREERIDVVHQPAPVSPRLPSLMYDLSGAKVVIGPLNGGMDYPPAFRGQESAFSRFSIQAARLTSSLVNRILPGKRRAATILVANSRTRQALPAGLKGRVVELVENAVDMTTWQMQAGGLETSHTPILSTQQFLFMGRLVDWKRLDIVLRALCNLPQATLTVVGEGSMRGPWQALTRELGLAERVRFLGWQPQSECARLLAGSVALLLPSIYECGGAVVLEAMASGRPVVATAWGGPVDYLDAASGFLVPPASYAEMVSGFAACMHTLLDHPAQAKTMGETGRQRVLAHFDWQHKIDQIQEIYRQALT